MTNLGSAKELMGRLTGEQADGMVPSTTRHQSHQEEQHPKPLKAKVNLAQMDGGEDMVDSSSARNKRSVSVDSGLPREKAVRYEDVRGPQTIYEEHEEEHVNERDVSDSESVERKRGGRRAAKEMGPEGDDMYKVVKGKKGTTTTAVKSTSRLRGRADIHN